MVISDLLTDSHYDARLQIVAIQRSPAMPAKKVVSDETAQAAPAADLTFAQIAESFGVPVASVLAVHGEHVTADMTPADVEALRRPA